MRNALVLVGVSLVLSVGVLLRAQGPPMVFGEAEGYLSSSELARFLRGFSVFSRSFQPEDGLGPEFNARSCAECHREPVAGGSGTSSSTFVTLAFLHAADPIGRVRPRFSAVDSRTSSAPIHEQVRRRTPPLFGIGRLAEIPVEDLLARVDVHDRDGDGISGRMPVLSGCSGRFGWQSTACTLEEFIAAAFEHELGMTIKPEAGAELSASDFQNVSFYLRNLAPPPRPRNISGERIFVELGCGTCHSPVTGVVPRPEGGLMVRAYTDLLLHSLADNDPLLHSDVRSRNEYRTPPLWGLNSTGPPYLHDGSAPSLEAAILAHSGEAKAVKLRYLSRPVMERNLLLEFLRQQ